LKKWLIGMATAIAVIMIAVLGAPFIVPQSFVKAEVASLVREKTGRDLRIDGPISFTLAPQPKLIAEDVALSNPPGSFSADFVAIKTVELSLKLDALLRSAIEIDQLTLTQPTINFEIDKDGRRNWVFHRTISTPAATPSQGGGGGPALDSGNLKIVDGVASYLDQRGGKKHVVNGVTMVLSLPSFAGPLHATGTALANADVVSFAVTLASPATLRAGGTSDATLNIAAPRATLGFSGQVAGAGPTKANGAISIKMPSLRNFLNWADLPFAARSHGLGEFSLSAKIAATGTRLSLDDTMIALDGTTAKGTLTVARSGPRPTLSGHLDVDRLDLDPAADRGVQAPASNAAATNPPTPSPRAPSAGAAPATASPPAASPTPSPGWNNHPIDLSALKLADADLTITAGAMRVRGIAIDKSDLALHLKDGRAELDLAKLTFDRGDGTGKIVVDSSGELPAFAVTLQLNGVAVRRVPIGIAGFDELSGTGDIYLLLSGRGRSVRDILATLDGGGSVKLANGTIGTAGFGSLMKSSFGPAVNETAIPRETPYASLSATAMIAHGILRNSDLQLSGPKLSATGDGTLDLAQRRIDYLWLPVLPGLGSARMMITGAWDEPAYKVESVTINKGAAQPPRKLPAKPARR
jgi:AsmA protein